MKKKIGIKNDFVILKSLFIFLIFFRLLQAEYDRLKIERSSSRMTNSLPNYQSGLTSDSELDGTPLSTPSREEAMLAEAKLLRQHKSRLEARMQILEDHNSQLESQLHRLRQLLESEPDLSSSPIRNTNSLSRGTSGPRTTVHNSNNGTPIRVVNHHTNGGSYNSGVF